MAALTPPAGAELTFGIAETFEHMPDADWRLPIEAGAEKQSQ
jgi:hypothetical protein